MTKAIFTTAIGTPLTEEEDLHLEGLRAQLADQWNHGIDGILVAGTMGAMQLLKDETYHNLIKESVEYSAGRGEILVGAGDVSFVRSRDRIRYINQFKVDGIAVLAPFFWNFSQSDLIDYYTALADEAKSPLYLYDLPQVTGTKISLETMMTLAKHPNIRGAKLSGDTPFSVQALETLGDGFRVIVAKPDLMDMLLRSGVNEHLDGMWAICPEWTIQVSRCGEAGDWEAAAQYRRDIVNTRNLLVEHGSNVFTFLMNQRGIPGIFMPRPIARLSAETEKKILANPLVQRLLKEDPARLDK